MLSVGDVVVKQLEDPQVRIGVVRRVTDLDAWVEWLFWDPEEEPFTNRWRLGNWRSLLRLVVPE